MSTPDTSSKEGAEKGRGQHLSSRTPQNSTWGFMSTLRTHTHSYTHTHTHRLAQTDVPRNQECVKLSCRLTCS